VKVLLIPEDQTLDQYILKPVMEALFAELRVPARISVLPEPRLRGSSQALDPKVIREIVQDNPMVDLFILIIDRDCDRERAEAKAEAIRKEHEARLLTCLARQEVEVWMLALHSASLDTSLETIREHCDPKERWAMPLLDRLGTHGPGGGRKKAMRKLQGSWRSLRDRRGELKELETQVSTWQQGRKSA
jgi:hypothetical protein